MNTPNYAEQITKNLEAQGKGKDYILGYLESILNNLSGYYENQDAIRLLKWSVEATAKPLNP